MTLGEKITYLRQQNDVSQETLASELMVTTQTVYNWERDKSDPGLKNIGALCSFFSVSPEYFIPWPGAAETAAGSVKDPADSRAVENAAAESAAAQNTAAKSTSAVPFLIIACCCFVAAVICGFITVAYSCILFTTNKGIVTVSTTEVDTVEYAVVVFLTAVFLGFGIASLIYYLRKKKINKNNDGGAK